MITTTHPYKHNMYIVKQYGEHLVKIIYLDTIREKGWEEIDTQGTRKGRNKDYQEPQEKNQGKLDNNLSRAKSAVKELALCNPWKYWVTLTIDPQKYDRHDLKAYFKDFSEFLHNYNRRSSANEKVKYIFIPEQHKDGAWHMHGFMNGIREKDLYTNQYGYLTWRQYEQKFGYISMSTIRDIVHTSRYALKYMTKDGDKNVADRNAHVYYASHGLNRAQELYRGHATFYGTWDYEQEDGFYKVKTFDPRTADISEFLGGADYGVTNSI